MAEVNLSLLLLQIALALGALGIFVMLVIVGVYMLIVWMRHKDREEKSLEMTCIQVAVPRDNEIKTDAMEQIFGSLSSIKKGKRGL